MVEKLVQGHRASLWYKYAWHSVLGCVFTSSNPLSFQDVSLRPLILARMHLKSLRSMTDQTHTPGPRCLLRLSPVCTVGCLSSLPCRLAGSVQVCPPHWTGGSREAANCPLMVLAASGTRKAEPSSLSTDFSFFLCKLASFPTSPYVSLI